MADSSTLTVRLPAEVNSQLGALADRTRRTRSHLAGEAIGAFVRRELEIIAGVERGLEDARAGRTVEHEAAMDELDASDRAGLGHSPLTTHHSPLTTHHPQIGIAMISL